MNAVSVRRPRKSVYVAAFTLALAGCPDPAHNCEDESDAWKYRCDGDVVEKCTYFAASNSAIWLMELSCKDFRDGQYHCEVDAGDRCETVPHDACCVRNPPGG